MNSNAFNSLGRVEMINNNLNNSVYNINDKPMSQSFVHTQEFLQSPSGINNRILADDLINHSVNYNYNRKNLMSGMNSFELNQSHNERNVETMRNLKSVLSKIDNKIGGNKDFN